MTKPAPIVVCIGKDCRKAAGFDELLASVRGLDHVDQASCQDLCHGPIVGLRIDGDLRWYDRIRTHKQRAALLRAVTSGRVPGDLRRLEIRKRRNELRHRGKTRRLRAV
jgi:hypothetical protein